jgi:MFS family permease
MLTTVLIALYRKFGLDGLEPKALAALEANIVSTLQAGCFLGALASSPIADRWGRKPTLIWAAVISLIGIILQFASSGHLEAMYIGR